jgi:MFS family permease
VRKRLAESSRAFSVTTQNPSLLRAQLAFGATWTAEWAFTVALAVVAFRDGGATAVGLVGFARMAPAALLSPIGAALGDRFRRDRVLIWSCLIRAGATGVAALLLALNASNIAVYALAALATAGFTVFRPAHSALLPGLCTAPLDLMSANVVRGLMDSLSMLLGPLLAALLLSVRSPAAVFATSAMLALGSAALLVRLSYEVPPRTEKAPLRRIGYETLAGFRALSRYQDAGLLIGLGLAQALTRGFLNVFVVVIALDLLHMGSPGVGLLTAAVGAGAVIGSLAASMFVSGRCLAALEGYGVALWGLPLVLCAALPYQPVVVALMCVIGVANALVDIGLYTLPARLVAEDLLARVFGAKESLTALSVALGSLMTPPVIDLLGIRGAVAALGLVGPVLVVLAWPRLRTIDRSITYRDEEIDVLQQVAMLRVLPVPAIDTLALRLARADVKAGHDVFRQGDAGDRFYVIFDGEADVVCDGCVIRTMRSGDAFGEIALLRSTTRTATVRARTHLRLYALDGRDFISVVSGYRSSAREADALVLERLES